MICHPKTGDTGGRFCQKGPKGGRWVAGVAGNPKLWVAGLPAYALSRSKVAGNPESWVAGVAGVAHFCTPSLLRAHIRDQAGKCVKPATRHPGKKISKHRKTCHPKRRF